MACTSIVRGSGLNVNGCVALPNFGDYTVNGVASFQRITFQGCQGDQLYLDGVDQGGGWVFYPGAIVLSVTCDPEEHDCINGNCVLSTTYNTPGLYESLEACEIACGTVGCSGKCVSNSEYYQTETLASQLKNANCG